MFAASPARGLLVVEASTLDIADKEATRRVFATAGVLLLGQRWGIQPRDAVNVLADGAGGSRMLQVRGPQMQDRGWEEATMKVEVWQKDMHLISAALRQAKVPAPLFGATVPIYDAAMGMGHAQHDTAAVFDVLDRMSSPARA